MLRRVVSWVTEIRYTFLPSCVFFSIYQHFYNEFVPYVTEGKCYTEKKIHNTGKYRIYYILDRSPTKK